MGKRREVYVLSLVLAVFLLGCDGGAPEPTDANQASAGQLREDAEKTLQTAKDLAARERDKLLEASRQQLSALEQQFRQWAGEVAGEDELAKAQLAQLTGRFEDALVRAREVLAQAGETGAEAWEEAKPDLEIAVSAAQNAYDAFVAHVKSQARREDQTETDPSIIE